MKLFIHPSFKDVAVTIKIVYRYPDGRSKVKMRWYNIHTHKNFGSQYEPWLIDHNYTNFTLTSEALKEFKLYTY